jgi:protein ImuB
MRPLRPAVRVRVSLRERRPVGFVFRAVRYEVERAYGPWVAEGDWWSGVSWAVEQWDLIARDERRQMLCCCVVNDRKSDVWQMVTLYD